MKILFGLLAALSMTSAWAESHLVCRSLNEHEGKPEYVIKYNTDRWYDRADREHYETWVEVTHFGVVVIPYAQATWDSGRQFQYIDFRNENHFGSINYKINGKGIFFMDGKIEVPIQCDNSLFNKLK